MANTQAKDLYHFVIFFQSIDLSENSGRGDFFETELQEFRNTGERGKLRGTYKLIPSPSRQLLCRGGARAVEISLAPRMDRVLITVWAKLG